MKKTILRTAIVLVTAYALYAVACYLPLWVANAPAPPKVPGIYPPHLPVLSNLEQPPEGRDIRELFSGKDEESDDGEGATAGNEEMADPATESREI